MIGLLRNFFGRFKERRAFRKISKEILEDQELRLKCLQIVMYCDIDSPEELIEAAESVQKYVKEGV